MKQSLIKQTRRARRKLRVRKSVFGTPERPRLTVTRSHRNISAQIIDDLSGRTLCSMSTSVKDLQGQFPYGGNAKAAAAVGKALGEKALEVGIKQVCFDRNGYSYHGRVQALANAAREAGLKL